MEHSAQLGGDLDKFSQGGFSIEIVKVWENIFELLAAAVHFFFFFEFSLFGFFNEFEFPSGVKSWN